MPTVISGDNGVDKITAGAVQFDDVSAGMVIQVANYTTGAVATGTTTIPYDDTIPQITEGTQFMSLAFTPKKANSLLKIETVVNAGSSVGNNLISCLFRDATSNAIAVQQVYAGISAEVSIAYTCFVNAVSATPTTFTVRIGGNQAGTITFNGRYGTRQLGGSLASSITITEIAQ